MINKNGGRSLAVILIGWMFLLVCVPTALASDSIDFSKLIDKHGVLVYVALCSLPESMNKVLQDFKKDESILLLYSPRKLGEILGANKNKVISQLLIVSLGNSNSQLFNKVDRWCIAFQHIETLMKYKCLSEEIIASGLYATPFTKSVFNFVFSSRAIDHKEQIHPLDIGATLSSSEYNSVIYSSLNIISTLDDNGQLLYWSDLFKELNKIVRMLEK